MAEGNTRFTLTVVGWQQWDEVDDNIDVEISLEDGRRYTATFFTVQNIATLFEKNKRYGECANGTYFCAIEMILVERLTRETMETAVRDLLNENSLHVFATLQDDSGGDSDELDDEGDNSDDGLDWLLGSR